MSEAGVDRNVAERVLGHKVGGGVERTYDRFAYIREKGAARSPGPSITWSHVWTLNEVEQWLANRPVERPVPNASDKGRR
jgi:hypothetical protein